MLEYSLFKRVKNSFNTSIHSIPRTGLSVLLITAMRRPLIWLQCFAALGARAQQSTESSTGAESTASSSSSTASSSETTSFSFTNSFSIITTTVPESDFTGSQYTYLTYNDQSQVTETSSSSSGASSGTSSGTATGTSVTQSVQTTTHQNVTQIAGSSHTGTTTSSAPAVSNTVPCNNYPEFCNRKYSNITEVCAHNSAFSIKNNAASNQVLSIVDQLDDGVRMSMHPRTNIPSKDADYRQSKAKSTGSTTPCTHAILLATY
jgi:hypothetical protein